MKIKSGICLFLICFAVIGYIFFNSSQTSVESNSRSYKIAEKIIDVTEEHENINYIIQTIVSNLAKIEKLDTSGFINTIGVFNLFIRKCAHAFEFFLLDLIFIVTFTMMNVKFRNVIIYSLFAVLLSAVCDEFLQLFVVGRTSSVVDILIDFFGGITACIIFVILKFTYNILVKKYKHIK